MAPRCTLLLVFVLLFSCTTPARANDAAAEVAAGGILLRREPRISMNKEKLTITQDKVTVEYEFLNESDSEITSEVAFPVPPYEADADEGYPPKWFENFQAWVDDRPLHLEIDAKATFKNTDYTAFLKGMGIDLLTFAHFDPQAWQSDLSNWPAERKAKLLQLGLIDSRGVPQWTLAKTYHWNQRFPPHKTLRVRHAYEPVVGFEGFHTGEIAEKLKDACIDPSLPTKLAHVIAQNLESGKRVRGDVYINATWVKYILTTANTWKTPIKDFELVVDRRASDNRPYLVSFCWDGPVQRVDANRFSAKKLNFVPEKELTVYFLANF